MDDRELYQVARSLVEKRRPDAKHVNSIRVSTDTHLVVAVITNKYGQEEEVKFTLP